MAAAAESDEAVQWEMAEATCAMCGEHGKDGQRLRKALCCNALFYCGRACQKRHWPTHKRECKARDHAKLSQKPALPSAHRVPSLVENAVRRHSTCPLSGGATPVGAAIIAKLEQLGKELDSVAEVVIYNASRGQRERNEAVLAQIRRVMQEAAAIFEHHPIVGQAHFFAALCLQLLLRPDEAMAEIELALTFFRTVDFPETFARDHWIGISLMYKGPFLAERGQKLEAVPFYMEATAALRRACLATGNPTQDGSSCLATEQACAAPSHQESLQNLATSLASSAGIFCELERYDETLEQALEARTMVLSRPVVDKLNVAQSEQLAGKALLGLGRYAEARAMAESALEQQSAALGRDHVSCALILQLIGDSYMLANQLDAALPFMREQLRLYSADPASRHSSVSVTARWQVSATLFKLQKYEEAIAIDKEAHAILRAHLSTDDWANIFMRRSHSTLGERLHKLGRSAEALPHCEQALALAIIEHSTLTDPPQLEPHLVQLLTVLQALAHRREMLMHLPQLLRILENRGPEGHNDLMHWLGAASDVYDSEDWCDEACAADERLLELQKAALGERKAATVHTMLTLGTHLAEAGRKAEALPHLRRALKLRAKRLSSARLTRVGFALGSCGDYAKARECFERALERLAALPRPNPANQVRALDGLSTVLACEGRVIEAKAHRLVALELEMARLGADDLDLVARRIGIAEDESLSADEHMMSARMWISGNASRGRRPAGS